MGTIASNFTLDDYKNRDKDIEMVRSRLNEYEAIFKEKKEMVLNNYDSDFIETNFGYLNTDISDEDLKKVKDIETQISNSISEKVLFKLSRQVDVLGRFNNNLKDLNSDFCMYLEEHIRAKDGYTEEEKIDKLIEPLENKKVYIPKANVKDLRINVIAHMVLNGILNGA
jgi:hypothetical protein